MAVRVNHEMPLHTVSRIKSLLKSTLSEQKILVCGVSYREDVGDTRYSPSEILVKELINQLKSYNPQARVVVNNGSDDEDWGYLYRVGWVYDPFDLRDLHLVALLQHVCGAPV